MRYVKPGVAALVLALLAAWLHWTLPSRDIVRVLGTDVVRMDQSPSDGDAPGVTRDLRLVNAISPDGAARVYRNEDTGWGWPPYFKFNSANLAAEAENAVSTAAEPRWMVVTHYGWRIALFSTFPNAVSMRPADGPDETLIPWFNLVVLAALGAGLAAGYRRLRALFA